MYAPPRILRIVSTPLGERGQLVADLEDARTLARPHVARAVARLAEIMEYDGRQTQSAVMAATTLIKLAHPDMDDPRVMKLVEEKFKALVEEARKRLEARQVGAIDA